MTKMVRNFVICRVVRRPQEEQKMADLPEYHSKEQVANLEESVEFNSS